MAGDARPCEQRGHGYDCGVIDIQVLLDGRGATSEEHETCARSLLTSVPIVELVHTDPAGAAVLQSQFPGRVEVAERLRSGVPVLVSSGRALFAAGALRRILADNARPDRCVTRLYVPGLEVSERLACWSPFWLSTYDGGMAALVDAGEDFDRDHLPVSSPMARHWIRGEDVGVALAAETAGNVRVWSRRTGLGLDARQVWGSYVRAPAGVSRRRLARWRQRRQSEVAPRAGR